MGSGEKAKVAMMFTGQGSQYQNMGKGLYANEPVFRDTMDKCDELLQSTLPLLILLCLLHPAEGWQRFPCKHDVYYGRWKSRTRGPKGQT